MQVEFLNTTEEEFLSTKLIHKFLPVESALDMLSKKYFWLADPKVWKDPFEKRFIEASYGGKPFAWKDRVFCTCLTGTSTSEAFWNTYSKNEFGVQLKIRREILLQVINNYAIRNPSYRIIIGRIEYKGTNDIVKSLSAIPFDPPLADTNPNSQYFKARLLLLKRIAYQYENEYRVIVVKDKKTKELGIKMPFGMSNEDLIDSITLDPNLKSNISSLFKSEFNRLMNNTSSKTKVFQSQLYVHYKPAKY
ncbi:MAG: DUF2971 domain-containing protein [Bacteroidales bacterium]|nr:DUF2971 domain-containing protein [Bacteroidales bacterium]